MFLSNVRQDMVSLYGIGKVGRLGLLRALLASPGFQVVFIYRLSFFLRKNRLAIFSSALDRLMLHFWGAEIKSTAVIGGGLSVAHPVGLVIGGKVIAGKNLSVRQGTTIGGNSGKSRKEDADWTQPIIGDDVKIGCNAVIIGPIQIGSSAVIGACSLVISDVAAGEKWAGVPARAIQ